MNSNAGLTGSIILDEQNFDIRRWPRSFSDLIYGQPFRGGGQRFRLEALPGTQFQRYSASWMEPYLFDTPVSFGLSGNYFTRRFVDWDEQRLGGARHARVRVLAQLDRQFRLSRGTGRDFQPRRTNAG